MKTLAFICIAAAALALVFACGEEGVEAVPTSTPDAAATAAVNAQATAEAEEVIAASVRATLEALPTDTPAPTNTPVPTSTPTPTATPTATHTPEPTSTPTPVPTSTPEPTATPTPTSTPEPTSTPTPEPTSTATATPSPTATPTNTPTPIPVGDRPDRAFAFQQWGFIGKTEPKLRLRVQLVLWGHTAEEDIQDYNERYNIRAPVGYSFVLVRMQITNEGDRPGSYNALSRLRLVSAEPDKEFSYGLGNGMLCDEIRRPFTEGHIIDIDHDEADDIDHTEQGHVCFLVRSEDAGDAILLDNGGEDGSIEDWRYWKLRGTN